MIVKWPPLCNIIVFSCFMAMTTYPHGNSSMWHLFDFGLPNLKVVLYGKSHGGRFEGDVIPIDVDLCS